MSTYIIPAYGGNPQITVSPGQINTTSTSVKLVGFSAPGYGYAFAENLVRMLSHHAGPNPPSGSLLIGQQWYDTTNKVMKFWNGTDWVIIISSGGGSGGGVVAPPQGGLGISPTAADKDKFIRVNSAGNGYIYVTINDLLTSLESAGLSTNYLKSNASSSPTVNNAFDLGSTTLKFANVYATTFRGNATSANYADVAERYEADKPMEPGDVVRIGGDKEITLADNNNPVYGVISTNPAIRMNENAGNDDTHPFVGLVGRLPVKVIGTVKKGDRLFVSTINGVATADPDNAARPYFGFALEDKYDSAMGLVEVALKRG